MVGRLAVVFWLEASTCDGVGAELLTSGVEEEEEDEEEEEEVASF